MKDINTVGVITESDGSYLMTFSGTKVSVLNPQVSQIHVRDICHALAMQCRYNGQCVKFYSVAEHVIKGAMLLENQKAPVPVIKAWLLHDASEAYVGDVIRPVKMYLPEFKEIENVFHNVIYTKYDVDRYEEEVFSMDNIMCALEKHVLMSQSKDVWKGLPNVKAYHNTFDNWGLSPENAEKLLLEWFDEYFDRW